MSHGLHADQCSADVAWKIFPCFRRAKENKASMGSIGKTVVFPWIPCFFPYFLHQGEWHVIWYDNFGTTVVQPTFCGDI